jgi:hypothetical protein
LTITYPLALHYETREEKTHPSIPRWLKAVGVFRPNVGKGLDACIAGRDVFDVWLYIHLRLKQPLH